MHPQLVDQWIAKLQTLPARDQATCVMFAAQRCEPIARKWFARQKLADAHQAFLHCFSKWQAGTSSDNDLEKAARSLDRRLNREIENEQDVIGAMAAHSLMDVEAVALGFSPEALEEILTTAVFFAAASFTGSQDVPIQVDADRLSPGELHFIEDWWAECLRRFPGLAD